MTLLELNSLRFIEAEIRDCTEKIMELRSTAESVTQALSAMPHGSGPSDKVGRCAVAIAQYTIMLENKIAEKVEASQRIHEFIETIEDAQTRRIMYLRFIEGRTWKNVAYRIGGGNTPEGVRSRAMRYINRG